jgi:dihydroorotase
MVEYDLILRSGIVVTPEGERRVDVAVNRGQIAAVGDLSGSDTVHELDAQGMHILPGAIDTQVHFREPGLTHKEDIAHGTAAAICGGVTAIFEMPNTNPATTTAEALADKLARSAGRAYCDYAYFVGATPGNADQLAELEQLPGTPGIKMFAGSSTGDLLVERREDQRRVMAHGVRPMPVHSEDEQRLRERKSALATGAHVREHPNIRDAEAARMSTAQLIELCEETGRAVHLLHISTLEELPLIRAAKEKGLPITCEVTPHHLTLCADDYERLGTLLQMNPPVRGAEHRAALWAAVQEGLFDVVGSDHAPHTLEEKAKEYPDSPSGMPGVETLLPLMIHWALEGRLSLAEVVRMTNQRPCSLYGIAGKGAIEVGFDADLVVVDLNDSWTVKGAEMHSLCGWSPYEGMTLRGRIRDVFLRGNHVVGSGEFLQRPLGEMVRFNWKAQGVS